MLFVVRIHLPFLNFSVINGSVKRKVALNNPGRGKS